MRNTSRLTRVAAALALAAALPGVAHAQAAAPDPSSAGPLYEELARMDSVLFDAAFVACDAPKAISLFTDDAEFYHDQTGLETGARLRATFQRLAGDCPRRQGVARRLLPGTLRVFPMHGYGAVQTGVHRFVPSDGGAGSTARFVHLWRKRDGEWKIARVLSFDHRAGAPAAEGGAP